MNIANRTKRIQTLIEQLNAGNDVALRDLKTVLTPDEWIFYLGTVEERRSFKELQMRIPERLKKYNAMLKIADFSYSRAESKYKNGDPQKRSKRHQRAQHEYERALECLGEALDSDSSLHMCLDRPFHHDSRNDSKINIDESPTLCPSDVPRLIGSSSFHREGKPESLNKVKRSLKLSALRDSLETCLNGGVKQSSESDACILFTTKHKTKPDFSRIDFD